MKDESGLKAVATRLADMILVSHKFDNELSHERGIGKVFDALIRHHSDVKSQLATEVWSQFANIVTDDEDDDIDPLEIMRHVNRVCQKLSTWHMVTYVTFSGVSANM